MRHAYGYTAPADPTYAQLQDWLSNAYEPDGAYDYYCQVLLGGNTGGCASNPYTGNQNIYEDQVAKTTLTILGHIYGSAGFCLGAVLESRSKADSLFLECRGRRYRDPLRVILGLSQLALTSMIL